MIRGQAGPALCAPPSSGISGEQVMLMSLFCSIPDLPSLMFVEHTQSYSNPPAACDYLISADREFVHALTNQTREQQSVRRSLLHSPCTVTGLCWYCWDVLYKTKRHPGAPKPLCNSSVCVEQPNTPSSHAAPAKPDVSSQHPHHRGSISLTAASP